MEKVKGKSYITFVWNAQNIYNFLFICAADDTITTKEMFSFHFLEINLNQTNYLDQGFLTWGT